MGESQSANLGETSREAFEAEIQKATPEQALQYLYRWELFARPEQLAPDWAWKFWLIRSGRGWGKTRTGAEWVRDQVENEGTQRTALVGATAADVRDVMIEGESGLLACCPPRNKPKYEPSKRRVTWPNGAIATTYSADEPDRLRGPQHEKCWADELAAWRHPEAFDQLKFGLRLGENPRGIITTTPRPTRVIKKLIADKSTHVTRGSTYDNAANLAPSFLREIIAEYKGTRLGRQELDGEILEDNPDALWTYNIIDQLRKSTHPDLERIVVAIDPSTTSRETSSEAGIIAAGRGIDGHAYVLADGSRRDTPSGWASKAVALYHSLNSDRIIAEVNNGGDLVETVIRVIDPDVSYKSVHASRGKLTSAEPISALYDQRRVHHVGAFPELEDQMTSYVPGEKSPDRMDALVWALTELMLKSKRKKKVVWDPSSGKTDSGWDSVGH